MPSTDDPVTVNRRDWAATGLALAGFAAVALGVLQEGLHVAPGFEARIETGWGGPLNHEEILLRRIAAFGAAASLAAVRWRRIGAATAVSGIAVLYYPVRAIIEWNSELPLYTTGTTYDGRAIRFVLGAEPFLLLAGGALLVTAGVVSLGPRGIVYASPDAPPEQSSAAAGER